METTTRTAARPASSARERVLEHLKELGLPMAEEQFDESLREAEQGSWPYVELLDRLFSRQALQRRERTIQRRIRQARFPANKTLENFDWGFNAHAIDRAQIEELATGDFVRRGDNLLLVGQSGIGKSHLLEGIARRACQDYRIRYIASDELLAELSASLADGTTVQCIRSFVRPDLLIIDGFGFDRIEREQSPQALNLIYKVIEKRGSARSTAMITNIDFDAWNEYLRDGPLVMALLDRLFEKAIIMRFPEAKSYRAHQARSISSKGQPTSPKKTAASKQG
jgi:DNA replication protein DnaC